MLTNAWYWDMNEDSREFAQRYFDRVGSMPNMSQAANYSSTMHYLRAIEEAGTDDPDEPRRLDPTVGDPRDVLRRLLRDAAG